MRKVKFVSLFVLLALLVSVAPGAVLGQEQPPQDQLVVSSYLETQANPNLTDEDKIKNAIDVYFKLRYEGQKLLEAQDFSFLIANDPQTQAWAQREKDKREVELYTAATYQLNYVKYEYFLDYDSIAVENGIDATVRLRESHNVVFEAIAPEVSSLGGLEHVITLNKTRNGWVVVSDEYQDELTQLMAHDTKGEIIERVRRNRQSELQQATQSEAPQTVTTEGPGIKSGTWHSYDRTAAVQYAHKYGYWPEEPEYVADRNPAYFDFDGSGGDCTNYVSQVIYAGAPQMDNTGSYQWYYYNINNRSPSWSDVGSLHTYLTHNDWTGPYGSISSMCYTELGDVIQLYNGSYWFHSLMVVETIYPDRCWDPSAIRYNCHTEDRYYYPLSFVGAYTKRYIHIEGWRD